ncbi:MAG: tRNA (adenosine(37)-N6)-threonylcarbamoyltransferase complex transferase subunit TsaD [Chloroflexi bacterium]|nr:tRNA (adenosine(37)-N6)-threonylcarbamoyltransferase complex transferase subunit TsaD [Chloroflexota bacterium]
MRVLGFESSCDESAIAIVDDGRRIVAHALASQSDLHARFGGVVPEIASRQHLTAFPALIADIIGADPRDLHLDAVAVTYGPGLAGALLVGINMAKALAFAWDLPLVGVHHLEGHLYANWIEDGQWHGKTSEAPPFPSVALIVSGGHTDLVLVEGHGAYKLLGRTRDDAAGEGFDKVARMLGLGFPGGPPVERAARGATDPVRFPKPVIRNSRDFSFSGLKSAVLRAVEARGGTAALTPAEVANLAAGFQQVTIEVLAERLSDAARAYGAKAVLLSGGVAANGALRDEVLRQSPVPLWCPRPALCTDNGVMIAACAHYLLSAGIRHDLTLDVNPTLPMVLA